MPNAKDYMAWRGDIPFEVSPITEVDLFLFSQLITPDYAGIVSDGGEALPVGKVAEAYFATHTDDVKTLGALQSDSVLPMLKAMPSYPRFAALSLSDYVNTVDFLKSEQFSALCIHLPTGDVCVAFCGTDDTIIGWKEDFLLSVTEGVPAQKDAVRYLKKIAEQNEGGIYVCGHSKGGNLAVYSAVCSLPKVRERIKAVYSFDGPGFMPSFLEKTGYIQLKDRIFTVLSQNSMVGILMKHAGIGIIVESDKTGFYAHDGFSWQVYGREFVRRSAFSSSSLSFNQMMDGMLEAMTDEEKIQFIDEFFDILLSTGAQTVSDLSRFRLGKAVATLSAINFETKFLHYLIMAIQLTTRSVRAKPPKPQEQSLESAAAKQQITEESKK